ncbi:MAG: 16S rRNA (adenine(1518)-N(6)/adenine(1519)-N(6))-dimethyltransferase RsmA [Firmicutes bacterium]|jgi:16S rRNA (adenine1518-N6/adenine1519-N6)-dimethyltransferase|nr:16S rRNA (adenine(1518)-N(6)/adenine(1519)-N(6))-dimethyltransferase RsmA [Bacillota bacterium]
MPGDAVVLRNTRSILEKYGLQPKKALGQNFLIDRNIRDKIVDAAAITGEDVVLEIGPGVGTLTEELARRASRVIAVELDGGLVRVLRDRLPPERVAVVEGDVLALDLPSLLGEGSPIKIVANLPYYITSPIIFRLLEWPRWEMMVIMVQGEVADRLVAGPGTKAYGSLSAAVALHARAEILFRVSRRVFYPQPQVDSAVVRLLPRRDLEVDLQGPSLLIRAAFGQRRKTLANALAAAPWNPLSKEETEKVLLAAGIDPLRRGESLRPEDFLRLWMEFQRVGKIQDVAGRKGE